MSRTALVTGAAQGIGRAIALRLAGDGFNVAVNDINTNSNNLNDTQKAIERLGRKSICITADVSNEKAVENMMKNVAKEFGSLDVVVANAGVARQKSLLDLSADEWDRTLSINLRGVFLCYKEAAKVMIAQNKGGKLIGACSAIAYRAWPMFSDYCASKWGVRGLTQAAAIELAKHNITVNAYCPGYVGTAMVEYSLEELSKLQNRDKEDIRKDSAQAIPLGRMSQPEDIANFVSYLASKDSDYMTGQSIIVDGGAVLA